MASFSNGFEGYSNGTNLVTDLGATGGNAFSSFTLTGGTAVASTAQHGDGTVSMLLTPSGLTACYAETNLFSGLDFACSVYYFHQGLPSAATQIIRLRNSGSLQCFGVNINTSAPTGKVQLTDASGGVLSTYGTALTASTWYRIEVQCLLDATNAGTLAMQVFAGDSTTALFSTGTLTSVNTKGGSAKFLNVGNCATGGMTSLFFDSIQASDAGLTPLGPFAAPPVASFTHLEVSEDTFVTDTSTPVSPATIATRAWDFGDGIGTASGATASYSYPTPGTYAVTLTVTDSNGKTASTSSNVTVAPAATVGPTATVTIASWTPSSGTPLSCIQDNNTSTLLTSSTNPSSLPLRYTLGKEIAPGPGLPFIAMVLCDTSGTGTWTTAKLIYAGSVVSTVSGTTIPAGSGGSVSVGWTAIPFPAADWSGTIVWPTKLDVELDGTAS